MPQITVSGLEIDVIRKDIKNVHLAVYPPTGRIRIAAPLRVPEETVRIYAISRLPWIRKQLTMFAAQDRQSPREYVSGESHYFQGRRYLLHVTYGTFRPSVCIRNNTIVDLHVRAGADRAQREQVFQRWRRERLKEQIPPLLEKWRGIAGLERVEWGVKRMRTKWGSCSIRARRIWLNLELVDKPSACLEYVIAHELTHLLERNHNDQFVAHMDRFLPHWRVLKDELNRYPLVEYSMEQS